MQESAKRDLKVVQQESQETNDMVESERQVTSESGASGLSYDP